MKNIDEAICALWNGAEDNLSLDELRRLSGLADDAMLMANGLATVCDGLGSLLAEDQVSGALTDSEGASQLIWSIGRQADAIGALSRLGGLARAKLDDALGWTAFAQKEAMERLKKSEGKAKK